MSVRLIIFAGKTYDLGRLEDGRDGYSNDEYQSHGPMDGTVVERVELFVRYLLDISGMN